MDDKPEETGNDQTDVDANADVEDQESDVAADYLRELDERAETNGDENESVDVEGLRKENDRLQRQLKAVSDAYVELRRGGASKSAPRTSAQPVNVDDVIKATRPTYSRTF
jgi:hypothetical protein